MASGRVDISVVMQSVSAMIDAISGTGAGQLTVRQLGEPETSTYITAWCRILGLTYIPDPRQRQGADALAEPDTGTLTVRVGVYVTPSQTAAAAVGTACQIVYDVFDEVTWRDTINNTGTDKLQLDFGRAKVEIADDPDPERGLRIGTVTATAKAMRVTSVTRQNFLT
jgi:hypothetical protein